VKGEWIPAASGWFVDTHGHEHTIGLAAKVRIGQLERLLLATDERAKRAEAEIRAKDEAIGELLEMCRGHYEWKKWWCEEDQCHSGGFFPVNR
jgi:hypothetical protein